MKLGLALSGGGFRATLYHLGVVRYLRDAGCLKGVTHITSVSGGSILAAHLVVNWDRYTGSDEDFDAAAKEIIDFVRLDVRNRIVRRFPLALALSAIRRIFRLGSSRLLTRTGMLERHYRDHLFGDTCLYELPDAPELHILSTALTEGGLFSFSRSKMLFEERVTSGLDKMREMPVGLATIPMAVAASSAFPGFFPPLRLTADEIGLTEGEFQSQFFTDGGVYDNLGARMFRHLKVGTSSDVGDGSALAFDAIISSDAGRRILVTASESAGSFLRTALRASDILMDRVWQFEREQLSDSDGFVVVPMSEVVSTSDDPTAPHPQVQAQLSHIRTDLDHFDDLEISGLVQHGYCVARHVMRGASVMGTESANGAPWDPVAKAPSSVKVATGARSRPGSEASKITNVARHLHRSAQRKIWTMFSLRDWVTYLYLPILLLIFFGLPVMYYNMWKQAKINHVLTEAVSRASPDVDKLISLVARGSQEPWSGMQVHKGDLGALFAERGLDIISDRRIIDARQLKVPGGVGSVSGSRVYVYRVISVRKTAQMSGDTALWLLSLEGAKAPRVRCDCAALQPVLQFGNRSQKDLEPPDTWQLKLNFETVPVGHTTEVVVEAMWEITPESVRRQPDRLWAFRVDGEPELASAWVLLPSALAGRALRLVRYPRGRPNELEYVEATYEATFFDGAVANWVEVHPKQGYTYTYHVGE